MKKPFTEQESLQVIEEMIAQARYKPDFSDSLVTLCWGYLVFMAALLHWVLLGTTYSHKAPYAWLLMLVGLMVTIVVEHQARRKRQKETFIDRLGQQLWMAFGVSFTCLFLGVGPDGDYFLPLVIMLYGMATWINGALMKFVPYYWGAIACWGCSLVAFLLPTDQQLLVLAVSAVLGYIVPGHVLRIKTKAIHV